MIQLQKFPLETLIVQYDKILLIPYTDLLSEFCEWAYLWSGKRKVLLLSPSEIKIESDSIAFWQITRDEARGLTNLYLTYEFADYFCLVSPQNANYAFLYNFVKTGILNVGEFFEALLD